MQIDSDEVCRRFPWVKELWLFAPALAGTAPDPQPYLLVVSAMPPRQVGPAQRRRLLARVQQGDGTPADVRLTTSEQLARWLAGGGRFASAFRSRAVKLFERPADRSQP